MSSIISGDLQGMKLEVPKKGTRPTSQRVKEALFSTLDHYGLFDIQELLENHRDLAVLDLYCGSGALGIEALSRGYTAATFVDMSANAINCVKENVSKRAGFKKDITYQQSSVSTFLKEHACEGKNQKYLLVFIDPPYDLSAEIVCDNIAKCVNLLAEESILILEQSSRGQAIELPEELEVFSTKKYGETVLYYIQLVVK
ncbi:16S rRNA (guanine(966)-N(2))-methyltransferase RsmD [Actinomyces sp. zg-332]|uniref:16S rRNA (guanine(966)-N(2))-methyltransferase RsmD n=1 Tax=Actinomyces sp. zg-332 TaxID=2708340 RepID=UPI00141EB5DD|nr:16S rRNA (guanine(966)-N(2))-methyltransferase RsmD [Actinomyces sp. zg-332]QPK94446.1 16S rRNA (guanine(966)-N(2))-methyltransferase RsmD [Actinomyces sp. zg-332]